MSKCKITKDNINILIENDELKAVDAKHMKLVNINEDLNADIAETWPEGKVIPEEYIDDYMNKNYGAKSELRKAAAVIYGLMDAVSLGRDRMYEFIITHIPPEVKAVDSKGNIDLRKLPLSTLKVIFYEVLQMYNAISPTGQSYANFGGRLAAIRTPKELAKKEPTGAYFLIQDGVKAYPAQISSRINIFLKDAKELKRLAKKYKLPAPKLAMADILEDVKHFAPLQDPELLQDLFHKTMMGWAYIGDDNKIYIYKDYGPLRDENGKLRTYSDPSKKDDPRYLKEDVIHGFQNSALLEEYGDDLALIDKGEWKVELTDTQLERFKELLAEARKIDDIVFEYVIEEMGDSLGLITEQLSETFPLLSKEQINLIFFKPDTKAAKDLLKTFSSEYLKSYRTLKEIFGTYARQELILESGIKVEKRRDHFPVKFNKDVFAKMLDRLIDDFEYQLEQTKSFLASEKPENVTPFDWNVKRGDAKRWKKLWESKLNYAREVRNNRDEYQYDITHNLDIPFAKDIKYFSNIQNSYDLRSTKTDDSVYYDYLKDMMATIERNILISKLIHAARISDSDATTDAAINLFKVPFADPTVKGVFGISTQGLSDAMGGYKSPRALTERLRQIGGYITGSYLHGIGTVLTNLSALGQNIVDYGYADFHQGMKTWHTEKYRPQIEEFIRRSGITEFSDFFSRSMVSGIIGIKLEQDIEHQILGEMLMYHHRIKKGMTKAKSRSIFEENIESALRKSKLFLKNGLKDVKILKKGRTEKRIKVLKRAMTTAAVNTYVQWAITKEYEFKHQLEQAPISMFAKTLGVPWKTLKNWTVIVGAKYAQFTKIIGTMSSTEAYVRTISFVIGVNRAHKMGQIRNDIPWWEYTDANDINKAVDIGRRFSEFTNFGLSTQQVGYFFYGGLGQLFGKFKVWSSQKTGRDVNIIKYAYMSSKKWEHIQNNTYDSKAITRLFRELLRHEQGLAGTVIGKKIGKRRIVKSEIQQLKTLLSTYGLTTLIWDTLMMTPLRLFGLATVRKMVWGSIVGKTTRNFTSDVLSFMFSPLSIALRLLYTNPFEEEDAEETMTYFLRRTMLGYLPMMGWDFTMALLHAANEDRKLAVRKFPIVGPIVPVKMLKNLYLEITKD